MVVQKMVNPNPTPSSEPLHSVIRSESSSIPAMGCGADGLLALGDLYPAGDISPSYVLPPSTPDSPLYMNSRIRPQPRLNVC